MAALTVKTAPTALPVKLASTSPPTIHVQSVPPIHVQSVPPAVDRAAVPLPASPAILASMQVEPVVSSAATTALSAPIRRAAPHAIPDIT